MPTEKLSVDFRSGVVRPFKLKPVFDVDVFEVVPRVPKSKDWDVLSVGVLTVEVRSPKDLLVVSLDVELRSVKAENELLEPLLIVLEELPVEVLTPPELDVFLVPCASIVGT